MSLTLNDYLKSGSRISELFGRKYKVDPRYKDVLKSHHVTEYVEIVGFDATSGDFNIKCYTKKGFIYGMSIGPFLQNTILMEEYKELEKRKTLSQMLTENLMEALGKEFDLDPDYDWAGLSRDSSSGVHIKVKQIHLGKHIQKGIHLPVITFNVYKDNQLEIENVIRSEGTEVFEHFFLRCGGQEEAVKKLLPTKELQKENEKRTTCFNCGSPLANRLMLEWTVKFCETCKV